MSGRTARNMVITAPDGTEVIKRTAGGYDVAGIAKDRNGRWHIVAVGSKWDSVRKRTRAAYNKGAYNQLHVGMMWEETVPIVRNYIMFQTNALVVTRLFKPGEGWTDYRCPAGRSTLRDLATRGYTGVGIRRADGKSGTAEFTMDTIARSGRFTRLLQAASA